MRKWFILISAATTALVLFWAYFWTPALFSFLLFGPIIIMGIQDMVQKKQSIKRNFPIAGRLRYFFEDIRPKIQQYFVENDTDGAPI
ncbi:MAG: FMN-binding glutamate synthase family protein, partial [Cyclobacteriaceae bacterium]|nr:FMN-binding glutamate synthase family protein [Cyclobacteriaceae bacterium]